MADFLKASTPTFFRSDVSRGISEGAEVSSKGGIFGAGYIEGVSAISRGPALGHGLWIDRDFVAQVSQSLSPVSGFVGVKSRFTHPDLSGDGLAKGLGRCLGRPSSDPDRALCDLHFWESARKSPEGDLAEYVLTRAREDKKSFGASIAFDYDVDATRAHWLANGGEIWRDEYDQEVWGGEFRSPDPLNVDNLPHARLSELRAVDIVDDPAANPEGLFYRDAKFEEAESLLSYAIGLTGRRPSLVSFNVDPDRAGAFVRRFLNSKGLKIVKLKSLSEAGVLEDEQTQGAEISGASQESEPGASAPETSGESGPNASTNDEESVAAAGSGESPALSAREECARYLKAFGPKGAEWFSEGVSWQEAQSRHLAELRAENESLKKKIKALSTAESAPLSSGGADDKQKKRGGFATNIRFSGRAENN